MPPVWLIATLGVLALVLLAVGVALWVRSRRPRVEFRAPVEPTVEPEATRPSPLQRASELREQLQTESPPVKTHLDPKDVALVEYASMDLIPPNLKPVAFVDGVAPDYVMKISEVWFATPELVPANRICWGAVKFATVDLVPSSLKPVASISPVTTPIVILPWINLDFSKVENSGHIITAGV